MLLFWRIEELSLKSCERYTPETWRHHQVGGGRVRGPEDSSGRKSVGFVDSVGSSMAF